jgi:hypothetical protein
MVSVPINFSLCRIWGSHNGGYEELLDLHGYNAVQSAENQLRFRLNSTDCLLRVDSVFACSSALGIQAIFFPETSVHFQQNTFIHHSSMALQPFAGPWFLIQFRNLFYTDDRTPWTSDQAVARLLPTHRTTQTQMKRTHRHPCLDWGSNPRIFADSERALCH